MTIVKAEKKPNRTRKQKQPPGGNGKVSLPQYDDEIALMAARIAAARDAERHARTATAAYFRAQQRGFEPGYELEDWLAAEAEVAQSQLCIVGSMSQAPLESTP